MPAMPATKATTPLADAIRAADITQADLARTVGSGEAHMSRWVNGKIVPHKLYRREIAEALGCAPGDLWPGLPE